MRKSNAVRIYICNLMTQPGETNGFRASDHLAAMHKHAGENLFDVVILNRRPISQQLRARYLRQGAVPVEGDLEHMREMGLTFFEADLLTGGKVVRHDPELLAAAVYDAYKRWTSIPSRRRERAGDLAARSVR